MARPFPAEHSETLTLIQRLLAAAGAITQAHFRCDEPPQNKSDAGFDPVTRADREAETAIREILTLERGDDAVQGEEHGLQRGTSGWTWYLDPIDGTRAYIAGLTSWTTLIGLADPSGASVYGAIAAPALGEVYLGWPGGACLITPAETRPLHVSDRDDLRQARASTTDPFLFTPAEEGAWTHLRATAQMTRYGLDAYAYARLADGGLDLVVESGLLPWDKAALIPVVRGAGGLACDWRGVPATPVGGQLLCCAGGGIQAQALIALRRSAE
ncbi:MAG: inositol monophosphatase family protein [Pseudomonadota bacterium]